ncbi:MAG: hypothetical protein J0I20_07735 [Chloroflexi bacterium]|nr:hypothetical protein [Chloroflexota bacterium]
MKKNNGYTKNTLRKGFKTGSRDEGYFRVYRSKHVPKGKDTFAICRQKL